MCSPLRTLSHMLRVCTGDLSTSVKPDAITDIRKTHTQAGAGAISWQWMNLRYQDTYVVDLGGVVAAEEIVAAHAAAEAMVRRLDGIQVIKLQAG